MGLPAAEVGQEFLIEPDEPAVGPVDACPAEVRAEATSHKRDEVRDVEEGHGSPAFRPRCRPTMSDEHFTRHEKAAEGVQVPRGVDT